MARFAALGLMCGAVLGACASPQRRAPNSAPAVSAQTVDPIEETAPTPSQAESDLFPNPKAGAS